MKKVLLVIMFMLAMCVNSFSATTLTATYTDYPTGINGKDKAYVINSTNAVNAGASAVFKIPVDAELGKIKRVIWESQSTSWEIWLSSEDGETVTSNKTFYSADGTSLGFMSPDLNVDYYKTDTTIPGNFQFFTIDNTTTNITSWTLTLIYER